MAGGKKEKAPCQAARVGDDRGFFGLPACVIKSPAFLDLSVHARALLIEIGGRMNGWNNGKIGVCHRSVRASLRCSPGKVVRSFAELMEHGLIDCTAEGSRGAKLAREYRLTFVSTPTGPATNDYLAWTPTEKKSSATDAVAGRGLSATDAVAVPPTSATDAVTARIRKAPKPPVISPASATDAVAHLIEPCPSPETGDADGPETRELDPQIAGGDFSGSTKCAGCGERFEQVGHQITRRFCSERCRSPEHAGSPERHCEWCTKSFPIEGARGQPKRFCSETCRKAAERQRARARAGHHERNAA